MHRSKYGCQACEHTFQNEESLISHMDKHHGRDQLEATFFNPSASSLKFILRKKTERNLK